MISLMKVSSLLTEKEFVLSLLEFASSGASQSCYNHLFLPISPLPFPSELIKITVGEE